VFSFLNKTAKLTCYIGSGFLTHWLQETGESG